MSRRRGDLIEKDPSSIEPQGFDLTDWLAELGAGVTVSTVACTVTGPDSSLVATNDVVVSAGLRVQATLSGGTVGKKYTVTFHAVTSNGVEDDASFYVRVVNR